MSFVQKYYEDIFLNFLNNAYKKGLISSDVDFIEHVENKQDISNFYIMNLSVFSDGVEDVYEDMGDVYHSNKINFANEDDLNDIGDIIGCIRPLSTRASVELVFYTDVYETTKTIPAGTIISTDNGISYYTVNDVDIPAGEDEVNVYALAVNKGSRFCVSAETLIILDTVIEDLNIRAVTNPKASSSATDDMDDENYRNLIKNWRKENIRGSYEAYENFFINYDGLNSYKLIPNWNGSGTVKVVLDPGHVEQLRDVYERLTTEVCQFDEDISMFSFEPVKIKVYADCNVDIDRVNPFSDVEKDKIKSKIIDAIKLYIDGDVSNKGLGLGEDFIPYQLGVFIHDKVFELKNINFTFPTEPVNIADDEKCVSDEIVIVMN